MYGHTYSKVIDQPGKVVKPARGQLNRKNFVSRDGEFDVDYMFQSGSGLVYTT